MAPPPVTPSPHRFVIKREHKVPQTPLAQEHTPGPNVQFKSTPRFTFPSTSRPAATQSLPRVRPAPSHYLTPASKTRKLPDTIESFSDEILHDVHDSIEIEDQEVDLEYLSGDEEDDYKRGAQALKRRRITSSPEPNEEDEEDGQTNVLLHPHSDTQDSVSSSLSIISSPPPQRRHITTSAPHFLTATPAPPATPQPSFSKPSTFIKPPRFLPPDPSETAPSASDPLPEQFSPHRRGQKYLPRGLAAEVRDWLVNIESTIPSKEAGKKGNDEWLVRIVVDEVSGSSRAGMTLVRGRQVHIIDREGGEIVDLVGGVKIILAGESGGTGLKRGSTVELGQRVGIKGPVWEVMIEGVKYGVGVDWKVLP